MLGATQLLMMSSMDSHQQANLNIITASIDQLREVLSNVLDMAKLKKGAMELEQAPFDLPGILHQVACACVRCADRAAPTGNLRLCVYRRCRCSIGGDELGRERRLGRRRA